MRHLDLHFKERNRLKNNINISIHYIVTMEYIELIKEACENHTIPDIVWIEEIETLLENN